MTWESWFVLAVLYVLSVIMWSATIRFTLEKNDDFAAPLFLVSLLSTAFFWMVLEGYLTRGG